MRAWVLRMLTFVRCGEMIGGMGSPAVLVLPGAGG